MKRKLLIIDNDLDFLDTWEEVLTKDGYQVYKAVSLEQAEQILRCTWIHLAVIDLRIRDDNDDKDVSGLTWAKKEAYRSLPKIILTRYPNYQQVREALGPSLEGLPPTVDFIAKQDGLAARRKAVADAFFKYVRINWSLNVHFSEPLSFFQLANLVERREDEATLLTRTDEIQDLLHKLFYDYKQITIGRLLALAEGQILLEVFAFGESGLDRQFVVLCGQKERISEEKSHYKSLVATSTAANRIRMHVSVETLYFAATAYELIENNLEETVSFGSFYQSNTPEVVVVAIDSLYNKTLAPLYKKGSGFKEVVTLRSLYQEWLRRQEKKLSQATLTHRIEALCQAVSTAGLARTRYSPHGLTFHLPNHSKLNYPNPATSLFDAKTDLEWPIRFGTIHGGVNRDNILVNRQGKTWVTNFTRTGDGLLLEDFTSLEAVIKLQLLAGSDLEARYEMERRLLSISQLGEDADETGLDPEVQKAILVTNRIRHWAMSSGDHALQHYFNELLFWATHQLSKYKPELKYTRHQLLLHFHCLLLAAMICEKIIPPATQPTDLPSQAMNAIWIDEQNQAVWVEGRSVELSNLEYVTLLYLYHHKNQLCLRTAIADEVYNVAYTAEVSEGERKILEKDRIDTLISRLRKKLEANPKRPKYVETVRGVGYRLELVEF